MSSPAHLTRRFRGSLSRVEPSAEDLHWVSTQLTSGEATCWHSMAVQDRRHSIEVARRFVALVPDAERPAIAGALLHDVGKQAAGLGTALRVVATLVGPRTRRFAQYHDHEELGAEMLRAAGSDEVTVMLVRGRGPWAEALRRADDV